MGPCLRWAQRFCATCAPVNLALGDKDGHNFKLRTHHLPLIHWLSSGFYHKYISHIHTHTHMYTYTHTHMHTHMHTQTCTHTSTQTHAHTHMHTHTLKYNEVWLLALFMCMLFLCKNREEGKRSAWERKWGVGDKRWTCVLTSISLEGTHHALPSWSPSGEVGICKNAIHISSEGVC